MWMNILLDVDKLVHVAIMRHQNSRKLINVYYYVLHFTFLLRTDA